ncbi:unnamed protein product [Rhodiola kirilowii]
MRSGYVDNVHWKAMRKLSLQHKEKRLKCNRQQK